MNNPNTQQATPPSASGIGGISKEVEAGDIAPVEGPQILEVGQEIEVPPEVSAAGVRVQPTTVQLPPKVAQLGVKPVGDTTALPTAPAVAVPLTDDQIVAGLHAGFTSSLRWLAEWCKRKLKQLRLSLKSVGGRIVRVGK